MPTRPRNIPDAKRKGYVDNIETVETKLKLITLFRENNNYIPLTKIPSYYFTRFNRALGYMGKFMNTILSQHETIDCGIIVRLSEPLQQERNDSLPFNNSFNQQNENFQETEIEDKEHEIDKQKVRRWLEEIQTERGLVKNI
ncbi:12177_t:CDS:2 [Racocetra persica]|uniref:12177_t:CDS:1 n=1 Tax=Racocetra persica TaxID=160502 RepID=A0ACA9LN00_9GLOM|nr:12177_t:CDS:2 [Racocetra persica]